VRPTTRGHTGWRRRPARARGGAGTWAEADTGWASGGGGRRVDVDVERAIGGVGAEGASDDGRVGTEGTGGDGVGLGV
jgi:hypothetical protein